MKKSNFPTKQHIQKAIERISDRKFPTYSDKDNPKEFVEKVCDIIGDEFLWLLNVAIPIKHNKHPNYIYRVREYDSVFNLDLICEYSYPPYNSVGLGRCNMPKYPVFYGSDNPLTALAQIVRNKDYANKVYCISIWEINQTEEDMFVESFVRLPLPEDNNYAVIYHGFKEQLKKSVSKDFSDDQVEGAKLFLEYLDGLFVSDKNYSVSASLAHRTLYAPQNCRTDILIYPSTQTDLRGVNYAIAPNFVDNNMKLKRVYTVKIPSIGKITKSLPVSFLKCATLDKNVLIWSNIDTEAKKELIYQDFQVQTKEDSIIS